MSKTEFNPKVCSVPQSRPHGESKINTLKSQKVDGDCFKKISKDPFKTLMNGGNFKADSSLIGDMLSEMENVERGMFRDPYDALMGSFMWGDDAPMASVDDFEKVSVPSCEEIFMRTPGLQSSVEGTKAVLEQFKAKEAEILSLLSTVDSRLDPNYSMTSMRADEIEALKDYKEYLEERLGFCREQMGRAKFYYDWAKKDMDIAKEKAKEELKWWEKEE